DVCGLCEPRLPLCAPRLARRRAPPPPPPSHLGVGDRAPRLRRLIGLVDDPDAVRVEQLGATEEVVDRERNLHARIMAQQCGAAITPAREGARYPCHSTCLRTHAHGARPGDAAGPPSRRSSDTMLPNRPPH